MKKSRYIISFSLFSFTISLLILFIEKVASIEFTLSYEAKRISIFIVGIAMILILIAQIVWAFFSTKK